MLLMFSLPGKAKHRLNSLDCPHVLLVMASFLELHIFKLYFEGDVYLLC